MREGSHEVPYGYRGRVGLVVVGPNLNPTPEIARMLPPGIQVRETRIHMEPHVDVEECMKLGQRLPEATALLAEGMISPILGNRSAMAFACTAGSLVGGPGWDKREIELMAGKSCGIPCTTTTTSADEAMKWLGMKRIVIASPYIDEVNEKFREFYTASGFEVLKVSGLGIRDLYKMGATAPGEAYLVAREAWVPHADGAFIACTNFRCSDIIDDLERDLGKPVVTANQATAWNLLRMLGNNDPVEGYGALLRRVPRA